MIDTIADIADSLYRRCFWHGKGDRDQCTATMFRALAEIGEVAQLLSKWLWSGDYDKAELHKEAADMVIATVGMALNIVGSPEELETVIAAKPASDEQRGALHQGLLLRENEHSKHG